MIYLFPAWLFFFVVIALIGTGYSTLLLTITNTNHFNTVDLFKLFWIGYAVTIAFLQLYSLVLPINVSTLLILISTAMLSAFYCRGLLLSAVTNFYEKLRTVTWTYWVSAVILLVFVGIFATLPLKNGDTNLYHLNAVKWANEYAAVPGLSNLHGRLGFNSSFLLFGSLTNVFYFTDRAVYLCNSMLVAIVVVEWLVCIFSRPRGNNAIVGLYTIITCAFILLFIRSGHLSSLSTDIPAYILILVVTKYLLEVDNGLVRENDNELPLDVLLLSTIAALGALLVTTKLVGFPMFICASIAVVYKIKNEIRRSAALFALPMVLLAGFVLRNVILTGWIVYPFPIGSLHLDWSVGVKQSLHEFEVTKAWAKIPGKNWRLVLTNDFLFWFKPWFNRVINENLVYLVLICFSFVGVVANSCTCWRIDGKDRAKSIYMTCVAVLCLMYWFVTAPDIRFGAAYFWSFFAVVYASLLVYLSTLFGQQWQNARVLFHYFLTGAALIAVSVCTFSEPDISHAQLFSLEPSQSKPVRLIRLENGDSPPLFVYKPLEGNFCGNSPLPCSPYIGPHSKLALRSPGDLSKGFKLIDRGVEDAYR